MNRGLRLHGRYCEVEIDARHGGIVGGSWEDTQEFLTEKELQWLEELYPEYLDPRKIAQEIRDEIMFERGFKGFY